MTSGSLSAGALRSAKRPPLRDPAWPPALVACGLALAFYTATLVPGVAYWDTGEMQTVPYVLGIAHPTGFPVFVLGGWLFAHALPLGEPAWRLSLFSACASAAAAGVLAALASDLTESAFAGVAASLAFALGDIAWTRAVRAEVHDLALLAFAVAVFAAWRAARDRSARALAAAGLALGIGAATHPVVVLALPGIVAIAWPAIAVVRNRAWLAAVALALAPLAAYAYVPLRSAYVEMHALDPARALGVTGGAIWDSDAPSNAAAFARYLSGDTYDTTSDVVRAIEPAGFARTLSLAAETAYREYGVVALALALCGLVSLAMRRPYLAAGLAMSGIPGLAFAANFGAESDTSRYALEALWCVAAFAGAGALWLASAVAGDDRHVAAVVLAFVLLVACLWPSAPQAYRDVLRLRPHEDARAIEYDVSSRTAPSALVVATWPFATPLAYGAYVTKTFHHPLLCGWPRDYANRLAAWRARFGHVYFVISSHDALPPSSRRLFANDRYQLAESLP